MLAFKQLLSAQISQVVSYCGMWVGEYFFWYRPIYIVPGKGSLNVMLMWSLSWHFTNKSVTGAPYSIKSYSLSHSWTLWWRVRWLKQCRLEVAAEQLCVCVISYSIEILTSKVYCWKTSERGRNFYDERYSFGCVTVSKSAASVCWCCLGSQSAGWSGSDDTGSWDGSQLWSHARHRHLRMPGRPLHHGSKQRVCSVS